MRKLVITLTMVLCALAAGTGHSAGPREGFIPPVAAGRATACKDPAAKPLAGIAHTRHAAAPPSAPAVTATAALSNSVFEKFVRCPFGDSENPDCSNISLWRQADDRTAYYRDVIFAGTTLISNATSGETWTASFFPPDGTPVNFDTVTYVENGDKKCFIFPGQPEICGSSSIRIYWYFNIQCAQTGLWTFKAYNNGNVFANAEFRLRPQLGTAEEVADKITPLSQADPQWADLPYGNICHGAEDRLIFPCSENGTGQVPWTIGEQGCGLTSTATMLRYHGIVTDPQMLNDWLLENDLYDEEGSFDAAAAVTYAKRIEVKMSLVAERRGSLQDISDNVCKYGPVIVRVRNDGHSVTALGRDDDLTNLLIVDARDGQQVNLLSRYERPDYYSVYAGPEQVFTEDRSLMTIKFHSPVEAFVTDPLGRRQGLDPRTGTRYDEIPDAFYGGGSTIGPELPDGYEPPKKLSLPRAAEGTYTLHVVGTGAGTYDADFITYDRDLGRSQRRYEDIATAPGVVHTYLIEFSKAPGSVLVTAGGFDGGGQRPRDVNKFLSYAQPSAANTALAAGATSYQLLLFYGRSVIPSTFRAQLNGADMTSLFSPSPGGSQAVTLPLQRGRNVLQLSIDGNLPNRVATDSDRLVFEVP